MSQERSHANSRGRQRVSTTDILYGGLLPATYLNSFNVEPTGTEICLIGRHVLEINKRVVWLNNIQNFALNALAVCVNSIVYTQRLSEASQLQVPLVWCAIIA